MLSMNILGRLVHVMNRIRLRGYNYNVGRGLYLGSRWIPKINKVDTTFEPSSHTIDRKLREITTAF